MRKAVLAFDAYQEDENKIFSFYRGKDYIKVNKVTGEVTRKGLDNVIVKTRFIKPNNNYNFNRIRIVIVNPDNLPINTFKRCIIFRCYNLDLLKDNARKFHESTEELKKLGFVYVDYWDIKTLDKRYFKIEDYSQYRYEMIYDVYVRKLDRKAYQY